MRKLFILVVVLLCALPAFGQPTATPTSTATPRATPQHKHPHYLGAQSFFRLGGAPTVTPGRYCPPRATVSPCHGSVIDKAYWVLEGGAGVTQTIVTDSSLPGTLYYPASVADNFWFLECTGRVIGSTTTTNTVALRTSIAVSRPGDTYKDNDGTGGPIGVGIGHVSAVDGGDLEVLIANIEPWDRLVNAVCVAADCRERPLTIRLDRFDPGDGNNEPFTFDLFGCTVFWNDTLP